MPSGIYLRTEKIKKILRKRKIPIRTKEWNEKIGKANSKEKIILKCICGKEFKVQPCRKLTAKFCSAKCQRKNRIFRKSGYKNLKGSLVKMGNRNPMWNKTKENQGYLALHTWIRRRIIKPLNCQKCGEIKKLDLANKSHTYKKDITDWLWLCRKCHMEYDGYGKNLALGRGWHRGKRYKNPKVSLTNKGKHFSISTEFKKGQVPWNKGKKYNKYL